MTGGRAMTAMREIGYAKVNLALHVRHRRDDGHHALETVFAFCEHGDVVEAELADLTELTIDGPFADGLSRTDNLVQRACALLGTAARVRLTKNLPVASGIGGGSADAGATLRALARLTGIAMPSPEALLSMGADVPACVASRTARAEGVGEVLTALPPLTGTPVLLVNPRVPLSTGAVFNAWDGVDRGALERWQDGRNDLEAPARALVPRIGDVLDWLLGRRAVGVTRMSGSGATCFALFDTIDARDQAAREVATEHPDWWAMTSTLR